MSKKTETIVKALNKHKANPAMGVVAALKSQTKVVRYLCGKGKMKKFLQIAEKLDKKRQEGIDAIWLIEVLGHEVSLIERVLVQMWLLYVLEDHELESPLADFEPMGKTAQAIMALWNTEGEEKYEKLSTSVLLAKGAKEALGGRKLEAYRSAIKNFNAMYFKLRSDRTRQEALAKVMNFTPHGNYPFIRLYRRVKYLMEYMAMDSWHQDFFLKYLYELDPNGFNTYLVRKHAEALDKDIEVQGEVATVQEDESTVSVEQPVSEDLHSEATPSLMILREDTENLNRSIDGFSQNLNQVGKQLEAIRKELVAS